MAYLTEHVENVTDILNSTTPETWGPEGESIIFEAYEAVDPWKCFMDDDDLHVFVLPADIIQHLGTKRSPGNKWDRDPTVGILITKKLQYVDDRDPARDIAPWSEFKSLVDLAEDILECVYVNYGCIDNGEIQLALDLPLEVRHYATAIYLEMKDQQCLRQKFLLGQDFSSIRSRQDPSEPTGRVSTKFAGLFSGIVLGLFAAVRDTLLLAVRPTITQLTHVASKRFVSSWRGLSGSSDLLSSAGPTSSINPNPGCMRSEGSSEAGSRFFGTPKDHTCTNPLSD